MYKEMLRKTAAVGIPLLAITMVYTLVTGGQECFGYDTLQTSTSAISLTPVLRYYVFTAILFAFYGFSFQFSRPSSDVYHSLPVKRSDLYVSVLLATATWMGGTIILNVLEMFAMLLISGCPFVPAYILLTILFYFVASMLVYAAAAIGCALSGSILMALASTGVVLFLPRFVQFIFARGIVKKVPIIGWLDFGTLLDPSTNIATGLVVMLSRQVFATQLITLPHILYSLVPTVVMMGIGWWLFNRRPSEIAHKNGGSKAWGIIMSVALSFVVLLPLTMERSSLKSVYGVLLVAASLVVFVLYQLAVTQNLKRTLKTLPFFLISACLALGFSLLIDTAATHMRDTTPTASEIESVTFRGHDYTEGVQDYSTLLLRDVAFTDEDTKEFVAQALQNAVYKLDADVDSAYYEYSAYKVIEPVTLKLTNGKTIKRTIEFTNIDELNETRAQSDAYLEAVHTFPSLDSVQYQVTDSDFTPEENLAILKSYIAEATTNGIENSYYYRNRSLYYQADGSYITQGTSQTFTNISVYGYIGSDRYGDNYTLRLEAPDTVSLVMRTYNSYAEEDPVAELADTMKRFASGLAADNDDMDVSLTTFNYVNDDGMTVKDSTSFYLDQYTLESTNAYDKSQVEYMEKFVDLLSRATVTDDPSGVFIRLNWYYYDSTSTDPDADYSRPKVFLHFENEEDEQEYLNLIDEWDTALYTM